MKVILESIVFTPEICDLFMKQQLSFLAFLSELVLHLDDDRLTLRQAAANGGHSVPAAPSP